MSISAYTGLPGHGKSYGVVENVIIPACKNHRLVYTNIPCNTELFLERFGMAPVQFDSQEIIDNENWWSTDFEAGAIIVIDECWRIWPAGTNANRLRQTDKTFFAEHRHVVGDDGFSTEVVLVTQDLSQIASFMRNLVETTYRVSKLSKVGASKMYRVDVYGGPVTGPSPPIARREREIPGRFKKDVYQLYKSHTKSTVGAGDETRADGRFNVLKGAKLKMLGVALVACLFFAYFGFNSFLNESPFAGSDAPVSESVTQDAKPAPSDRFKPVKAIPVEPDLSDFLDDADRVFITYNAGVFPDIRYELRAVFGDGYADLTPGQLRDAGYQVTPVSQCLVRISQKNRFYIAVCESRQNERRDFLSDLMTDSNSSGARGDAG